MSFIKGEFNVVDFLFCLIACNIFFISGMIVGSNGDILTDLRSKVIKESIQEFNETWCNDTKDLKNAVICLNNHLEGYYNYNIRLLENNSENITDILENGGDCTEYSHYWKIMLEKLGYITELEYMYPINKSKAGHVYISTWDKNLSQYCTVDQLTYKCHELNIKDINLSKYV